MLAEYADAFANVTMTRADGVLVMQLHTDGSSLLWSDEVHTQLPLAFRAVANDDENRVVLLTGTGASFCSAADPDSFRLDPGVPPVAITRIYQEGKDLLFSLLDIPVPMVAAVNGPTWMHAELPLLCDVIIAADTTTFRDPHFAGGIVPGDGAHLVWPMLLGETRGRYFLLTDEELDAADACALGLVHEVVPADQVFARAMTLAGQIAMQPPLVLRHTREVLTARLKQAFRDHLPLGLALEGFANGYGVWR